MDVKKFILLTAHKSGSRLFLNSLDSALELRCHKRPFSLTVLFERFAFDRLASPFYKFRAASLKRQIDYFFYRKQLFVDFMTTLYTPLPGVEAIGIRLIYDEADKHPEILEWAMENDISIIHLIRKNPVRTVVETEASIKRGLIHSVSRIEPVSTIYIPPARLKMQLLRLTEWIEKYRARLKNGRYLEVFSESLLVNREAEIGRVLAFLNLEPFTMALMVEPIKLEAAAFEDRVENYEEVRQALKDTVFERFLN